jgi:hypothetical protein
MKPLMPRIAFGPVVLILLSLAGCGTAATQTTTVPPESSAAAAQRSVVGVLTSYEDAYSTHNASGLRAILSPAIVRTGEGAEGCQHSRGQASVLAAYESQWKAGAGHYQLIGLSQRAVNVKGQVATAKVAYRIAPRSEGPIDFRLAAVGKQWLITSVMATCHEAPSTTTVSSVSSRYLSAGDWKELVGKTDGTLLIVLGGGKAPSGEEGRVAFLHHEEQALSETSCLELLKTHAPCFSQLGELLAHSAAEARGQAAAMTEHLQGPCAEALERDAGIWAGLEHVSQSFEHEEGRGEGQDEWQGAAAPAERLILFAHVSAGEEPRTELGAGLEACRPPGDNESE